MWYTVNQNSFALTWRKMNVASNDCRLEWKSLKWRGLKWIVSNELVSIAMEPSLSILSFQNFHGSICLYLVQLSVKLVICRLSFVCYHCLEYVRWYTSNSQTLVLPFTSTVCVETVFQFWFSDLTKVFCFWYRPITM